MNEYVLSTSAAGLADALEVRIMCTEEELMKLGVAMVAATGACKQVGVYHPLDDVYLGCFYERAEGEGMWEPANEKARPAVPALERTS